MSHRMPKRSDTKRLHIQVPQGWCDRIDRVAEQLNMSRSNFIAHEVMKAVDAYELGTFKAQRRNRQEAKPMPISHIPINKPEDYLRAKAFVAGHKALRGMIELISE